MGEVSLTGAAACAGASRCARSRTKRSPPAVTCFWYSEPGYQGNTVTFPAALLKKIVVKGFMDSGEKFPAIGR